MGYFDSKAAAGRIAAAAFFKSRGEILLKTIVKIIKFISGIVILGSVLTLAFFIAVLFWANAASSGITLQEILLDIGVAFVFLIVSIITYRWASSLGKEMDREKEEEEERMRKKIEELQGELDSLKRKTLLAKRDAAAETPREERREIRYEERRKEPQEARREHSSPKKRMATAHFDGTGLSDANKLTVYIDDEKVCSYDGGSTRSVPVAPGDHVIRVMVYNDASESAYWLGPFSSFFEEGMEYDISYGD